jgi:DNA-binding NtrC family response regulator
LRESAATNSESPVVVIHEQLDASTILELLQVGASECLGRPLNMTRLSLVLDMLAARVLVTANPTAHPTVNRPPTAGAPDAEPFFADSSGMAGVMDQVRLVAPLDTTVLITGETGTGKTRLARLIHDLSPRRSKRFVAVNCGALSTTLVESELFGHVRGAFTGADREHAGKFAQCQDGTLLLDEIDALSLDMQVKFLRVVEERTFEAVGSERSLRLQARMIVATNRPLEAEVAAERFRSDLYYRLNVVSFHLPPLRERREEIGPLADQFMSDFAHQHRLPRPGLTAEVRAALEAYAWPGNVRQLRNVIERAVILSGGSGVGARVLPAEIARLVPRPAHGHVPSVPARTGNKLASARSAAEKSQLLEALRRNGNNRSRTATDLGISRVALYKQLRKFQMI